MLYLKLFGRDALPFSENLNQMAAVRKPRFLTDIAQIKIRKQQKILGLADAHEFYVFLAGSPIILFKALGKIRIAHVAHIRKFLNLDRLPHVRINVSRNLMNGFHLRGTDSGNIRVKASLPPEPDQLYQQIADLIVDDHIVAVIFVIQL